ncbi:pseudouridylate synthase [uncultured Sneathia sp.]|uniref:pseudouridylate synthase n=1 Tax=uncultured Sneathia sp. TaxID=278067 RepID=UPI002805BB95|nr:pseudouridylate synthase [uncultured Sneathia sp.]
MLDRRLEKTKLNAYMVYIKYDGSNYACFDELKDKKTVKGYFKDLLKKENIDVYKGIQQAGRTDKDVSANENILYFMSEKENIDTLLKYDMVIKIQKTIPYLEFPELIEKRKYIFSYPKEFILNSREKIEKLCYDLSGKKDFSKFTTKKGKYLKNTVRDIHIEYIDDSLIFIGDSFLPHQVRIMSSFILTNALKPLDGKYLVLDKIYLSKTLEDLILYPYTLDLDTVVYCEKSVKYTIIYTTDFSKMIGKNGKNIKKLNMGNKVIVRRGKYDI